MSSARRWFGRSALLAAAVSAAITGMGTSHADGPDRTAAAVASHGPVSPAAADKFLNPRPLPPVTPIPRPKPRPRPVVDPNIVGYAADGSPIYPWGPRPQAPKPVKPIKVELEPAGEIDPYQTPPIIPRSKLPAAPEVR